MIKRVIIKNYRCFKSLDITLQKNHAFIGENGNGKTTILEAIDLATSKNAGSYRVEEQDFNWDDNGDIEISVYFDSLFVIKIPDGYTTQAILCDGVRFHAKRREKAAPGKALSEPFVTEHYGIPREYKQGEQPKLSEEFNKLNIPLSVISTEKGYSAVRKGGNEIKFSTQGVSFQQELIGFPDVFYFGKDREKETKVGFNSLMQKISKDLNWRFRRGANLEEVQKLWNTYYSHVINLVEDPKNNRIIHPVQERVKKLLGKNFNELEVSLLNIEQPFAKIFLSLRRGQNQIEQENLGSGVSILIAYIFIETISKLAKNEFIFLVDEPELHLHAQVQHALLKDFQNASHQVIYTTQSDCMIDISEWRSIGRVLQDYRVAPGLSDLDEKFDGNKVSDYLDEIKKQHKHRTIFFREDNQIFFAQKCLLVEGPAEKYGLPILVEKLGFEMGNITIISCNGKTKIPYYQLLCKAFDIPYFTLLDLDGDSGNEKVKNDKVKKWSQNNQIEWFKISFESVLGIKENENHKASLVLTMFENINKNEIPKELNNVIEKIVNWCQS